LLSFCCCSAVIAFSNSSLMKFFLYWMYEIYGKIYFDRIHE
jgi:hypothetical protein